MALGYGRLSFYCIPQAVVPTNSFAYLQNQVMVVSNHRTLWVTGLSDWGPQAKTFLDLENGPGSYAAYPIAPPTVAFEQKAHSVVFPICRIKPVA